MHVEYWWGTGRKKSTWNTYAIMGGFYLKSLKQLNGRVKIELIWLRIGYEAGLSAR
jgi:hypothetical protein